MNINSIGSLLFIVLCLSSSPGYPSEFWVVPVPTWDRPPYTYTDAQGQLQGIDVAILTELASRAGIEFVFESMTFSQRQSRFIRGDIAIECCVAPEWRRTPEDVQAQLFLTPIYEGIEVYLFPVGDGFSIDNSRTSLTEKSVGTIVGYQYFNQKYFGKRVDHKNQSELLNAIKLRQVDVGILDRHVAGYYAFKNTVEIDFGPAHQSYQVSVRIHRNRAKMAPLLNLVIKQMKADGTMRRIIEREAKNARSAMIAQTSSH